MPQCLDSYSWLSLKGFRSVMPDMFRLGDYKNEVLKDGTPVQFRIIGFNHDKNQEGRSLSMTWEMVDCLPRAYPWYRNDHDDTDWGDCYLRHIMNDEDGEIYRLMPDDIIAVAEPAVKLTNRYVNGQWELASSLDMFFIKSCQETWGRKIYAGEGEGKWYGFYRLENTPWGKKRNDHHEFTMLRSPRYGNACYFCRVNTNGSASDYHSRGSIGVAPAFAF